MWSFLQERPQYLKKQHKNSFITNEKQKFRFYVDTQVFATRGRVGLTFYSSYGLVLKQDRLLGIELYFNCRLLELKTCSDGRFFIVCDVTSSFCVNSHKAGVWIQRLFQPFRS